MMTLNVMRAHIAGRVCILPMLLFTTSAMAATCYGRMEGDIAMIYCSGQGSDKEQCTFLWEIASSDGSDYPWRGNFQVGYWEKDTRKAVQPQVSDAKGNLNYTCADTISAVGGPQVGDVAQDEADHFAISHQALVQERSDAVAKTAKARVRQPCARHARKATSALDTRKLQGYDQNDLLTCGADN